MEDERYGEEEDVGITQAAEAQDNLFAAVARDARGRLAELLQSDPALARTMRADGTTPMHLAAARGYAEVMEMLLAVGADIDARDHGGHRGIADLLRDGRRRDRASGRGQGAGQGGE